jgi:hypothetical protein
MEKGERRSRTERVHKKRRKVNAATKRAIESVEMGRDLVEAKSASDMFRRLKI